MWVQEWGAGRPLICLHGLGGGGHFFAALASALGGGTHVVAPDLPGCGHSQAASSFSFDECADVVVEFARRKGWSRLCLLGHSMGAIAVLEAVRREPSLAAGVVLVGGLPEALPPARARLTARAEQVERAGLVGLAHEVVDANFSQRTRREHPELTALFGRTFELQSAARYAEATRALARWTARPLPALDDVACLLVTGEEDRYAPPDAVHAFAGTLPGGTHLEILTDCGHLPFLEQPETFATLLRHFLEGLPARS